MADAPRRQVFRILALAGGAPSEADDSLRQLCDQLQAEVLQFLALHPGHGTREVAELKSQLRSANSKELKASLSACPSKGLEVAQKQGT